MTPSTPISGSGSESGGGGPPADATLLLQRVHEGDSKAVDELLPLVYEQLRATAGRYFRSQAGEAQTLQATALVHEAYLKLVRSTDAAWDGRAHFCAVAAKAMRQILQDHARARRAAKRGGDANRVPMTGIESPSRLEVIDLLALDEALTRLAEIDERGARVVELRFFGGLTNDQAADILGVSRSTIERDWRRCEAWIRMRLEDEPEPGEDEAGAP